MADGLDRMRQERIERDFKKSIAAEFLGQKDNEF